VPPYTAIFLSIYDFIVLGFNNPFAWKCHNSKLLNFYNRHVSGNHLDVGVGSGYYPDKCEFPVSQPRVVLMDLNPNSLAFAANRIQRYKPTTYQVDVLQPVSLVIPGFDSISLYFAALPAGNNEKQDGRLRPPKNAVERGRGVIWIDHSGAGETIQFSGANAYEKQ